MKQLLIIISALFITIHSHGQIYVGLSSGVSITKFNIQGNSYNAPDCKHLIGLNVDIPVLFKINKNISLQSGLSYLNMGTTLDGSSYNVIDVSDPIYQSLKNSNTKYRLNYISLPLTCNFSIPLNKYSVYAKAGGYISTLVYATSKTDDSSKESLNINDEQLKTFDAGGISGIGVTRTIGKGYLFFDAKYMLGITNLNTSSQINSFPFGVNELNNRGLFLNIGYMFNLGKS